MSNTEHMKVLYQGYPVWNKWRAANPGIKPNLKRANLAGADLCRYNLNMANIRWTILRGANLQQADLSGAELCHADLRQASLNYADLSNANLEDADLEGADLSEAIIEWTIFNRSTSFPGNQE